MPKETLRSRQNRAELFTDAPIVFYTEKEHARYVAEDSYGTPESFDAPEICVVTEGSGIHQILGKDIPCKAGDVYIHAPSVPHDFYRTEEEDTLSVLHILFDPAVLLSPASQQNTPQYCYGVFQGNAMIAYAMLNTEMETTVTSLLDNTQLMGLS